jgi:hypothetical protein
MTEKHLKRHAFLFQIIYRAPWTKIPILYFLNFIYSRKDR